MTTGAVTAGPVVAAVVATLVLAALAVLQVLVATGRPYGRFVWGGQHVVLPRRSRAGSAVSVPLYAALALLLLWRSGALGTAPGWVGATVWVVVAYFVLGVGLNGISRSRPERLTMTPVCVVLAGCALVVALA